MIPLLPALLIFGTGLLLFRQAVVRVVAVLALVVGVLIAGNDYGAFVHTLLDGVWNLVTGT